MVQSTSPVLAALFDVILPAFFVIGVGAGLGAAFKPDLLHVNRLALYAAVPALVFSTLSTTRVSLNDAFLLLAGNSLFILVMGAVAWFVSWRFRTATRRGLVATSVFSNAANMMLPVTLFAFGEEGLQRALILYVFSALTLFTLGPFVLSGGSRNATATVLVGVLRLPVLWATGLGVAVNLLDATVPLGLARGIELLGEAAIPLVLLTLGIQIQLTGLKLPSVVNILGASLKLLVGPLVGFATGLLVGAAGVDLAVLTLLGAMPPAVNNFMLALEFGADPSEVAGTVILSTLGALATLSLVVYLLQAYVV